MRDGREDTDPTRAADVADAMRVLARERFLPQEQRARAHEDRPLPLWHGQTSSQPSTVAAMLRLLQVPVGARVLDVGSGSGWTTALLAHLTGPTGAVVGVERVPDLVAFGRANLDRVRRRWARIEAAVADTLGWPTGAPYDRILVSAEATELPTSLVDQLGPTGRMVIPVDGEMVLVVKDGGPPTLSRHGYYRFVPLR